VTDGQVLVALIVVAVVTACLLEALLQLVEKRSGR
jgi:hypothetical protein